MTQWLGSTLVWTSILLLLVLALREPVRRRFGAGAAYALWLIPALRMVLPTFTRTVERAVESAEAAPSGDFTINVSAGATTVSTGSASYVLPPAPAPSLVEQLGGWPTILVAVWLAGAALIFTIRMRDYVIQKRAILKTGVQIARLDGIRLIRSPLVRGPVAFGLYDRVIAVPRDFDQRFDPAERRLALDHELSHHRAGDLYANMIAFVLLCLQWFNPLAWVAHAAFRFDQEAACDARVLDKAPASDRLPYGTAIAKAASGRALLFASALDTRSSLKRRLSTMIPRHTKRQRLAGTVLVLGALGLALPLSATYAVEYRDVPKPPKPPAAPSAPSAPVAALAAAHAPVAPVAPLAPLADMASPPTPPAPPKAPRISKDGRDIQMVNGRIVVRENGKSRRWEQLSSKEKAEIREELAEARAEIADVRIDHEEIRRDIEEAMKDMEVDLAEARAEMKAGQREIDEAMAEVRRESAEIRASGQDPEIILASLRAAKAGIAAIDIEKLVRDSTRAAMSPGTVESSVRAAEKSVREAERKLAELERAARKD